MGIRLTDTHSNSIKINAWNWGSFWEHLNNERPELFDIETMTALRFGGVELNKAEVEKMLNFCTQVLRPKILKQNSGVSGFFRKMFRRKFYRKKLEKNYTLETKTLNTLITFLKENTAPIQID